MLAVSCLTACDGSVSLGDSCYFDCTAPTPSPQTIVTLDELERPNRLRLEAACLSGTDASAIAACEELLEERRIWRIKDGVSSDSAYHLRNHYLELCQSGDDLDACTSLRRVLRVAFGVERTSDEEIADTNRLQWYACRKGSQEACDDFKEYEKFLGFDYAAALAADEAAGGHDELFERIMGYEEIGD